MMRPEEHSYSPARFLFLMLAWLLALSGIPSVAMAQASAKVPAELRDAANVVETAENFERQYGSNANPSFADLNSFEKNSKRLQKDMQKADADITKYLAKNPHDVQALILQVRFDRAKSVPFPMTFKGGRVVQNGVPSPDRDPQKTLDLILQIAPDNAEANYWKARFYGLRSVEAGADGGFITHKRDLAKAQGFARKAVEKDLENIHYREVLATFFVMDDKVREAIDVLATMATQRGDGRVGRHPLHQILLDYDRVPLPDGSVLDRHATETFASMIPVDYPPFRVRVYRFPGPASAVKEYYRTRWPELQLVAEDPTETRELTATLLFKDGALVPATSKRGGKEFDLDGFTVTVMEDREPPTEPQAR